VGVGPRERRRQRSTLGVRDHMVLAARFAAVRGVWPRLGPPKTARTDPLSTKAIDQSSWSASWRRARRIRRISSHTPAFCQSRRWVQHVIPHPKPSSLGKCSQGMPVRRTKMMPDRTCRCAMGLRPGCRKRRRLCFGMTGSMSFHSASSTSGLAMWVPLQESSPTWFIARSPKHLSQESSFS
jgi:hypothetical protein